MSRYGGAGTDEQGNLLHQTVIYCGGCAVVGKRSRDSTGNESRFEMDVSEDELQGLYTWVDEIPLSRPKRSIARDFSDGVLVAEIIAHYFPKYVELHNYSSASSVTQKLYNWNTLNQKVFRKLNFSANKGDVEAISNCVPGAIERFLKLLQIKIAKHRGKFPGAFHAPQSQIDYRGPQQDIPVPTSVMSHVHPDGRLQEYPQHSQHAAPRPQSAAVTSEPQAYPPPPTESFPAGRPSAGISRKLAPCPVTSSNNYYVTQSTLKPAPNHLHL
eukprot:1182964-Prorocentrum_minimum.AAC.3